MVRKAFKVAEAEKPGVSFIDFPENVAALDAGDAAPLRVQAAVPPDPPVEKIEQAARVISERELPDRHGRQRRDPGQSLRGAGALRGTAERPGGHDVHGEGRHTLLAPPLPGRVGLQAHDYVSCGFDRADVIICVGYDMVEYHPYLWHRTGPEDRPHRPEPAEVDEHYILGVGRDRANIGSALGCDRAESRRAERWLPARLRERSWRSSPSTPTTPAFPIKPQKILWDLRQVLEPDDIVISDVGAHKMWMARMYQAERPNTCIISNGFASMGIAVPGAIGARIAVPGAHGRRGHGRRRLPDELSGDRDRAPARTPIVVLIWSDSEYGLIKWKQMQHFGRESHIDFSNPDFVRYAGSFGAAGFRVESAEELPHVLREALDHEGVSVIDCPVDYSENLKLTERLGQLICPI